MVCEKVDALDAVGGNILIHVYDKGTWTLVTHGPNVGLHDEATDDIVDFSIMCEDWVLYEMLSPEGEPDWNDNIEMGAMEVEGDPKVFARLLRLAFKAENALSVFALRTAV